MSHVPRVLLGLLVLAALMSGAAHACSCVKRTSEQQFRDAQVVVVGTVLETRYVADKRVSGGGYIRAVVEVRETLKGKPGRRLAVIDQLPDGGMCSSFLSAGVEYVLFLDDRDEVGMCSGTRPLGATIHDRDEKLKQLQDLKARAGA